RRPLPPPHARHADLGVGARPRRVPHGPRGGRSPARDALLHGEARAMTAFVLTRGRLLFERNLMVYRRSWLIIFSGLYEPLFYLFALGYGLGHFVGRVHGVSYASYIAPALLAAAAMNGAIYDATTNVFWKLRYA